MLAGEMEVDGDLNVSGDIQSPTIEELQAQITALQIQIDNLQGGELITGTVSDIDGNIYQTIQIGTQNWMSENLRVSRFNNGDEISLVPPMEWFQQYEPAYYIDGSSNTYGFYYNAYLVNDEREVCPEGWHIPTDEELIQLMNYNGGSIIAGGKMKTTGYQHWNVPNDGATNESGFSALPAGKLMFSQGVIMEMNHEAFFWSSDESWDPDFNWGITLFYSSGGISRGGMAKRDGLSIRCIQD